MKRLLVISNSPVREDGDNITLDAKATEGMHFYASRWPGRVAGLFRKSSRPIPFSTTLNRRDLPIDPRVVPHNHHLAVEDLLGHDVVMCTGDNHNCLHLADLCRKHGIKCVYIIENTPATRRKIVMLDRNRTVPQKIWSQVWLSYQERRRRRAFAAADGIQANGHPAFKQYSPLNPNTMMYLDSRARGDQLVSQTEMCARSLWLNRGAPIRLIHSGRLEPLKGSQDLIRIAVGLAARGVEFTFDIFGTGSLEAEIRQGINEHKLSERVRMHGEVDYQTRLVPFAREHADVYLSCHRQSDPSCTYLESMACGLAVIGYSNQMWMWLQRESGAGWAVPMGDCSAMCDAIASASADRRRLVAACAAAQQFACEHLFEREFERRIEHLCALL